MTENEIEKKQLLSKKQYEQLLLKHFSEGNVERKVQINYYYDTIDKKFYCAGETLRVRQTDNALKLQMKYEKTKTQGVFTSKELHKDIDFLPMTISVNQTKANYLGILITERVKKECETYTLFLDKNYYLGKIDFELEIEAKNFFDFPQEIFGIKLDRSGKGKYSRFIAELDKKMCATISLQCDEFPNRND